MPGNNSSISSFRYIHGRTKIFTVRLEHYVAVSTNQEENPWRRRRKCIGNLDPLFCIFSASPRRSTREERVSWESRCQAIIQCNIPNSSNKLFPYKQTKKNIIFFLRFVGENGNIQPNGKKTTRLRRAAWSGECKKKKNFFWEKMIRWYCISRNIFQCQISIQVAIEHVIFYAVQWYHAFTMRVTFGNILIKMWNFQMEKKLWIISLRLWTTIYERM